MVISSYLVIILQGRLMATSKARVTGEEAPSKSLKQKEPALLRCEDAFNRELDSIYNELSSEIEGSGKIAFCRL